MHRPVGHPLLLLPVETPLKPVSAPAWRPRNPRASTCHYCAADSNPAARAHRYLAPSTATGFSVVYGYATIRLSYRYSQARSTSTSPASEATTGLSIPFALASSTIRAVSSANTIGGVTMVCQYPR